MKSLESTQISRYNRRKLVLVWTTFDSSWYRLTSVQLPSITRVPEAAVPDQVKAKRAMVACEAKIIARRMPLMQAVRTSHVGNSRRRNHPRWLSSVGNCQRQTIICNSLSRTTISSRESSRHGGAATERQQRVWQAVQRVQA
jgi:hypothetical protein